MDESDWCIEENEESEPFLDIRTVGSMNIVLDHMAGHRLWYHSLRGYPRHRDLHFTPGPSNPDAHRRASASSEYTRERQSEQNKSKRLSERIQMFFFLFFLSGAHFCRQLPLSKHTLEF